MVNNPTQEEELAGIKLQFDALLAEYKMVRDAVAGNRTMQSQMDTLALAGLGLSIPLILAILQTSANAIGAVLLLPILFFAIAFGQLRQERQIIADALYVDLSLRVRASKLISKISLDEISVFPYEHYLAQNSLLRDPSFDWLATLLRGGISLAIGSGLIVLYFYVKKELIPTPVRNYEVWLLILDFSVLLTDLALAFLVSRMRYQYLSRKGYYGVESDPCA